MVEEVIFFANLNENPDGTEYKSFLRVLALTMVFNLSSFYIGYVLCFTGTIPFDDVSKIYKISIKRDIAQGLILGGVSIGAIPGSLFASFIQSKISPK